MKITEVEAIILRQPVMDGAIADGSQDDLIVRIHTDEGIVGIGEVDSAPEVAKAVFEAPHSHYIATGLRHVLIGQDPLDIEGLWRRMYMGTVYYGRRGVAMHAISGVDLALWDIKGKKLGKPVSALLGTRKRDRVRAYASLLMPDTEREVTASVEKLACRRASPPSSLAGARSARTRSMTCAWRVRRSVPRDLLEILIDAGFGYGADAKRAIRVARELSRTLASTGSRSRSSPTSSRRTPNSPMPSTCALPQARKNRRDGDFASWSSAATSTSSSLT